jgi:hypothetical protein
MFLILYHLSYHLIFEKSYCLFSSKHSLPTSRVNLRNTEFFKMRFLTRGLPAVPWLTYDRSFSNRIIYDTSYRTSARRINFWVIYYNLIFTFFTLQCLFYRTMFFDCIPKCCTCFEVQTNSHCQ